MTHCLMGASRQKLKSKGWFMKFLGFNRTLFLGVAFLSLASLSACTQDYTVKSDSKSQSVVPGSIGSGSTPAPSSPFSQVDQFNVAVPGSVTKTDILFVIDNSGSMEEEQTALADAFNSFISNFVSKNVDYHIGIISTDSNSYANVPITNDPANRPSPTPAPSWIGNPFFGFHNPFPNQNSTPGTFLVKNTYNPEPKFISPQTGSDSEVIARFKENAKLRIYGSGEERVIYNALQALDPKKLAEDNVGFRRQDAFLSIIGVTDENEQIRSDPVSFNGQFVGTETTSQQRIDRFKNRMIQACNANCPGWRVDLIVDLNAKAPSSAVTYPLTSLVNPYPDFYRKFKDQTGSQLYNIYSADWGTNLANIASGIITQAQSQFKLSFAPLPGSLKVFVNNVQIAESGTSGYIYLSASQTIQLNGTALSNVQGGTLKIEYLRN
jgi:hypothetical protein